MTSQPGLSFRHREPLFGLDIGHSSLKVMQLDAGGQKYKKPAVVGYGSSHRYAVSSIVDGVIVDYQALGNALRDLFANGLSGHISTSKVACTIPMSNSFTRPLILPVMSDEDLASAVNLDAEHYIPVALDNLYIDYEVVRRDAKNIELLLVATPKQIIESYMKFLEIMGLEPIAFEPTMNATARIFGLADPGHDTPTVLVDFGATATDIAIYDKTIFVSSTAAGGGSTLIDMIAKQLNIDRDSAFAVKNDEGISEGRHQHHILAAVKPTLDNWVREMQKTARYYNERLTTGGNKVSQVVITGGGANMPGLSDYLSAALGLPVRMLDPWGRIDFGRLTPPAELERSMFITVAGEAVLDTTEIFND